MPRDMLDTIPHIPVPTKAQSSARGVALLAIRDMGKSVPWSDTPALIVDGLQLANWTPEQIEALANRIGRLAHMAGRK